MLPGRDAENALAPMTLVAPGTLVFVVDDESEVRQSIADFLIMEGYDARPLPSADAAWTAVVHGPRPALIVLDLWIPGMTSAEFVRRLRASRHAAVPVLVLSGVRSNDQVESDVDAVTQKPIESTALVRLVDRLVSGGRRRATPPGAGRQAAAAGAAPSRRRPGSPGATDGPSRRNGSRRRA